MNTQPSLTLINCPACDKQVSNKAVSCPNCGHPLTETESPPKMTQAEHSASTEATVQPQPVAQAEPCASPETTAQPQPAVRAQSSATSDFTIGQILKSTVSTLFKKPAMFLVLGLLVVLPSFLLTIRNWGKYGKKDLDEYLDLLNLARITDQVFAMVLVASVAHVVFRVLKQETFTTVELRLYAPLFNDGSLYWPAALVGLITGLGALCYFVPGVILMVVLALTIPVFAIERPGVVDSVKRSVELTQGYRLPIFGLYMISGLLSLGFGLLIFPITIVLLALEIDSGFFVAFILPRLLAAPPWAFEMIMTSIIYFKLREVKEGVTLDSLAGAFKKIR